MIVYGERVFSNGKAILLIEDDHLELIFVSDQGEMRGFHSDIPFDPDDAHFRDLMAFSSADTFDADRLAGWKPGNRHFHIFRPLNE